MEENDRLEIFKTHQPIHLGALDETAARELIRDPVANQVAYPEEAIRAILGLSGRLPYLIQLLCSQLMNTSHVRRYGAVRKKDVDDIAETIVKDPASKMHLGVLYMDFKEMENGRPWKALCALAHLANEPGQHVPLVQIVQRLTQHESMANASEAVTELMEKLVKAGVVEEWGQGRLRTYRLTPDLLRLWLRKRHAN